MLARSRVCRSSAGALFVIVALACRNAAATDTDGITIRTLSYNVHGMHRMIAQDSPKQRLPRIGALVAAHYDLALLQEDFEYSDRLERELTSRPYAYFRGNGSTVEAGFSQRIAQVLFWLPARLILGTPMPQGAGLTTIVYPRDGLTAEPLVREAYQVCEGILRGKADCLAAKGFLGVRLGAPNGVEVDVYNTHLDSRGSLPNREIRRRQLAQLASAIRRHSESRAVIVAGDFNTRHQRPNDRPVIEEFQAALGLDDSGARRDPQSSRGNDTDYIFYRSGSSARIEVVAQPGAVGEDGRFRWNEGRRPLSDHPALFATLRLAPP
jgi:hypothetical protein